MLDRPGNCWGKTPTNYTKTKVFKYRMSSHNYSQRPSILAAKHQRTQCCCAFSTFERWMDITSTPEVSQIGKFQSSFLRARRHFIWCKITKLICLTQSFLCKSQIGLRTNSVLQQRFRLRRCKMYPKQPCCHLIDPLKLQQTLVLIRYRNIVRMF